MKLNKLIWATLLLGLVSLVAACGASGDGSVELSPEEARAIAKEAYIYGFPLVDGYRILHAYHVDRDNPEYKGPWNKISNVARGWYISEALLHEGKIRLGGHTISHYQQLSQLTGAVTPKKLAASPLNDNVQYLRFMVDPRLAEGKRAELNVNFSNEKVSYAIALRNGVIAITEHPNEGPELKLTKDDWGQLIVGEKTFASLSSDLIAFDQALGR